MSSLSLPPPVREGIHGGLNLYAVEANQFDDARRVGRTFASYAAVAVHNMHLHESTRDQAKHLDITMQTRAVIEQAQGILMSQRRCDAQEAFSLLAAAEQRSNRKLRDIAQAILEGVTGYWRPAGLSDQRRAKPTAGGRSTSTRGYPALRWSRVVTDCP